jgi:hypothetical protein
LNAAVGDHQWADENQWLIETLPDDATFADLVLALIDVIPEEGRKWLEGVLNNEDDYWPKCKCCRQRAYLVEPLVTV